MVFSISERVTHSADWPSRKKKLYVPHLTLKSYQMYKQSLQQAVDP